MESFYSSVIRSLIVFLVTGELCETRLINYLEYHKLICYGVPDGVKLPNTLDCSTFFICGNQEPKMLFCNDGLLFDSRYGICNWPELVICDTPGYFHIVDIQTEKLFDATDLTQSQQDFVLNQDTGESSKVETSTMTSIFPTISSVGSTVGTFPISITSDNSMITSSPPTPEVKPTNKSNASEVSDEIFVSQSTLSDIQTTLDIYELLGTDKIPSLITINGGNNFSSATRNPLEDFNPNHVQCLHEGLYFLPHPTKCELYFICENRNLHMHKCAPRVHWDYIKQQCDYPTTALCYYNEFTSPSPLITKTSQLTTGQKTTQFHASKALVTNSTTSESISKTTTSAETFLGTGIIASTNATTYTLENNVFQNKSEVLPKCPSFQKFFPHPTDCNKYYICIGGVPILTSCPDDLYWDVQELSCGHPLYTECTPVINLEKYT